MNAVSPDPARPCRYRFGEVLLDPAARRLEVARQPRHLEPKAFDLLLLLVEQRHRAVPKDELLDRIWPGRVVVEGVLKRAVGLVRHALGDDATEPRFVRTVHGIGYQFIGTVATEQASTASLPVPPPLARRRWALGLAAVALAGLLLVIGAANLWRDAEAVAQGAVRALILPFENATGDARLDWVERGLPALAAHALIEEPGLNLVAEDVAGRVAVDLGVGFHSTPAELDEARRLVAADHLVVGQLVAGAGGFGLALRLVDPSGTVALRRLDAVELAQLATDAGYRELREALLGAGAGVARRGPSTDPYIDETHARAMAARAVGDSATARDLLAVVVRSAPEDLHARMDLVESEYRLGERERLDAVLAPVERAAAADPNSALALRLALHHGTAADAAGNRDQAREHFQTMRTTAVQRDDIVAEADALRLLGRLAAQDGDWAEAQALMGRALLLFDQTGYGPGRAMTLGNLAQVYWRLGAPQESRRRYEEAIAAFEQLGRRDGVASMQGNLGNILYEMGDAEGALAHYTKALAAQQALGNRASEIHQLVNIARMQSILGRSGEAAATAETARVAADALGEARSSAFARMTLGELADKSGEVDDSVRWFGEAAERFAQIGMVDYLQAARSRQVWVLAEAGRAQEARALLDRHREAIEADSSPYMRSQALGAIAALAIAEGRLDAALEALSAGRDLTIAAGLSSNARWFTGQLALNLLRAGRIEEAEAWIGLLDDADGSLPDTLQVRARHAYERGDYAAAVAHKQRMRDIAEGNWSVRHETQLLAYREALASGRRRALDDEL